MWTYAINDVEVLNPKQVRVRFTLFKDGVVYKKNSMHLAVSDLVGKNVDGFKDVLENVGDSEGVTIKTFIDMAQTESAMRVIIESIKDRSITPK
jgi:hypothetical protein